MDVNSPALRYTSLRLGLFVGSLAVLVLLGLRGFLLLVAAVLLSGVLSYFLLGELRNAMGRRLSSRMSGLGRRIDAHTRAEDEPDDDQPSAGEQPGDIPPSETASRADDAGQPGSSPPR